MSLISIDQFEEFAEDYPELAQCYDRDSFYHTDSSVIKEQLQSGTLSMQEFDYWTEVVFGDTE